MGKKHRKYTNEFKKQALSLAENIGYSKASHQLGISSSTICSWKKQSDSRGKWWNFEHYFWPHFYRGSHLCLSFLLDLFNP